MMREDAEYLLNRPEFRRFLFAAIQSAGVLSHVGASHGPEGRNLEFSEGRRGLGFELLLMAHSGQPEAIRASDPDALATLDAVIREAMNPTKDKTRDRRNDLDRYNDIPD